MTIKTRTAARSDTWVLMAAILASSMTFIDSTALNVALPALQRDLSASAQDLLWIVNANLLLLSALILVGGSLGDIYGRKKIFMLGISLFATASTACGLAPNIAILIVARAVQGVGGALMVPGTLSLISATFPPQRRGGAIGTWSAWSTIITLLGPILGGLLAGIGLWRGVFLINVPIALATLIILAIHVTESRETAAIPRLDLVGTALVTFGLAAVTYGFIEAPRFGLGSTRILGTIGIGILALLVFILAESRSSHPIVPLNLFRSKTFSGSNLMTFFLYAGLNAALFFLTLNFIQIQGYPEQLAGLTLVPFGILLALLSRWAGRWADRIGPRRPLTLGPAIVALGFFLMALPGLTPGPQAYWRSFLPSIMMIGIGMGITVAPLSAAVMGSVSSHRAGTASGVNNAVARTAGVLAIAILGSLVIVSFSSNLESALALSALKPGAQAEIQAQAGMLAGLNLPSSLTGSEQATARQLVRQAFVRSFQFQAYIASALAGLSAVLAWWLIEDDFQAQQ